MTADHFVLVLSPSIQVT